MANEPQPGNIQDLIELTTRVDERIRSVQVKQHECDERLMNFMTEHSGVLQKIAVIESKQNSCPIHNLDSHLDRMAENISKLDRRVELIEDDTHKTHDRWKKILTFIIQLVWVLLASWLLLKLNLQAPGVP